MQRKTAMKAAKWWADLLRQPQAMDNGDNSPRGTLFQGCAEKINQVYLGGLSKKTIEKFRLALYRRLKYETGYIFIRVDYHPGVILSHAIEIAGMDPYGLYFPCKTRMVIDGEKVSASIGYGAPPVEI